MCKCYVRYKGSKKNSDLDHEANSFDMTKELLSDLHQLFLYPEDCCPAHYAASSIPNPRHVPTLNI